MPVEYRPARADEIEQFAYANHVGFGASTADEAVQRTIERDTLLPEYTLCAVDDDTLVSQMATLPFTMRWNGRDLACGGVTAVTTLPSHRRRGHLRELMTRAFAGMKQSGQPVAMLWASMAAIYQRFGYGIAYTNRGYDFDPRHLRFVDEIPTPGCIRMVKTAESQPIVAGLYDRFAEPRTLMLHRPPAWWAGHVMRPWQANTPPFLLAAYEEEGAALGYVLYGVEQRPREPGPNEMITVYDFAWLTPSAHRALVQYLAGYDLVDKIRMFRMPVDDPLFYHAQEPRLLGATDWDGTLVRIIEVQGALEGRGYDNDGRLTFSLDDEMCPWNSGVWELTAEGGSARLKRSAARPDLQLTPRLLAILASGRLSATRLAHIGLLTGADQRSLMAADNLFRTAYAPFCADGF